MEILEPLSGWDWAVIGLFFAITLGIGVYFSKRATGSMMEYFVAGRKMTWWLAGTSIVATSFAADTPLVISGWMRSIGLERNWFWWGGIMGMMLCTFFFARLWRRSGIMTDVEFNELRYGGKPAAGLRIFHATYRSLVQNTLTMCWVTLAMTKILEVTLNLPALVFIEGSLLPEVIAKGVDVLSVVAVDQIAQWPILGDAIISPKALGIILCLSFAALYSAISGLWGVMVTDFFQFCLAMTGSIILMILVFIVAGGPKSMVTQAENAVIEGRVINSAPLDRSSAPHMEILEVAGLIEMPSEGEGWVWSSSDLTELEVSQRLDKASIEMVDDPVKEWWQFYFRQDLQFEPQTERFLAPDNAILIAAGLVEPETVEVDGVEKTEYVWKYRNILSKYSLEDGIEKITTAALQQKTNGLREWKKYFTLSEKKFTLFDEVDKAIAAGLLIYDPIDHYKADYYRVVSLASNKALLNSKLSEAGIADKDGVLDMFQGLGVADFTGYEELGMLREAGIVIDKKNSDGEQLVFATPDITENALYAQLSKAAIRDRKGAIEIWRSANTVDKGKFNQPLTEKFLDAGILFSDTVYRYPKYYRVAEVTLSGDALVEELEAAGIENKSELIAAWRGDTVVPKIKITSFLPPFDLKGGGLLAIWAIVVFLGLQWWAGGEGAGFLAQRLFSCKDEKHSMMAMLWFNFANFVLRPWPWIVVGVASLFLIPDITQYGAHYNAEYAYPVMLMKYLPVGLKGLMVAALMAAYMSTISTHVNFGASYVVNDLYGRFIAPRSSERSKVIVSQIASVILALLGGITAYFSTNIGDLWFMMFELMSGAGFVVLLRWYWWRINAWSELAAMFSTLIMYFLLNNTLIFHDIFASFNWPVYLLNGVEGYPVRFTMNLVFTTSIWLIVTFLTKPEKEEQLIKFYNRIRPAGWWNHIAAKAGSPHHLAVGKLEWACWALGVTGLFAMIACLGKLCFGLYLQSGLYAVYSVAATILLFKLIEKMDWSAMETEK